MITAKEFLERMDIEGSPRRCKAMIEFAEMHVQAALQKANKNARIDVNGNKVIASGFRDRDGNQYQYQ